MTKMSTPKILPKILRASRASPLVQFWHWWTRELKSAFAPAAAVARIWFVEEQPTTTIRLGRSVLSMTATGGGQSAPTQVEFAGPLSPVSQTEIEAALQHRPKDVRLILEPDIYLRKHVAYPKAAAENLREVVRFDLDRQTPFSSEQAYFDVRLAESAQLTVVSKATNIMVELVAVPRNAVDTVLATLRAAGAKVCGIGIMGDGANQPFDLLPQTERQSFGFSVRQKFNMALAGLTVLLAMIALGLPIWQKRERIEALRPLANDARTKAARTRQIEAEFNQGAHDYNFLVGKKHANYAAVEILDEVSRFSPDTTWLQYFELKSSAGKNGTVTREIQVTGEAASASRMIELFEQSKLLQNASQRAQTTRGNQAGVERFQIASEVKAKPAPAAVGISRATVAGESASAKPAPVSSSAGEAQKVDPK